MLVSGLSLLHPLPKRLSSEKAFPRKRVLTLLWLTKIPVQHLFEPVNKIREVADDVMQYGSGYASENLTTDKTQVQYMVQRLVVLR